VPLNDWLRMDKYYAMVKEKFDGEIAAMFFDHAAITGLLEDHKSGKKLNMKKIWTIYTFILWYEEFFVKN
ncbi:MAG: asparagine synthetase B, partial [Oscillospiraceae bacterium]|nr:asparagine synthetase B [Oscillospiraceae bacterium]